MRNKLVVQNGKIKRILWVNKKIPIEEIKKKHSILVMESQKRYPEKVRARKIIERKILKGEIPPAKQLKCFDCGKRAECYDHARGYLGENCFYVEAVCWPCHRKRGVSRGEYKNGS